MAPETAGWAPDMPFRLLALPVRDAMQGMDGAMVGQGTYALPAMLLAMLASWWVYVPLHELCHAWGCLLAGGTVTRLEIDGIYGAAWLAQLFPYVVPGSEYAGRLSGFDTGGSDAVYLCTVFFPFLLTILAGVPLLRTSMNHRSAPAFGAALPWAYAPFLSLTGDYYEMGSILISRWLSGWLPNAPARWRGDDLPLLAGQLFGAGGGGTLEDTAGLAAGLLLGTLLALLTYAAGRQVSRLAASA